MVYGRSNSAPLDPSPRPFQRAESSSGAPLDPTPRPLQPADTNQPDLTDVTEEVPKKIDIVPENSKHTGLTEQVSSTSSSSQDAAGRGWGRGIVQDFRQTVGTYWCAEMTNFNQKTLAVSFFLFFACIAPAITFGAVYGKATNNWIGAVEMLVATAYCGIVYALIGGQPMMINGGTGPVLAFTEILFKMSENMGVPFLTFNAWIGLWVCFYMCLAAFGGLNRIIVYATRFTDEIFALLISVIFIINALGSPFADVGIYYYFESDHKSHEPYQDDPDYSHMETALLSLLVCIGTVQLAFALRRAKFSPFLPSQKYRDTVTDFAVVASILVWTLIAQLLFTTVSLETLNVPDKIEPTFACCTDDCTSSWPEDCPDLSEPARRRSWLVDLGNLNGKGFVPIMAAGPALLAFILVFLDDGITWHLINHPAHKLTHGSAFDYDTVVIGVMIAINAMFGLPILVAATVRSLNHVHAMAEKSPDGKILSVQETRLTHLFIHILCLVSLFALSVLKQIPMPVLYGVFLFMGLVSLGTNTFWNRLLMFFMQPQKYPLEPYTVHMKPRRMHLFTGFQLGLFAILYTVKAIKTIAIAFPLIIALCIPFRYYILPKIFTEKELIMIDSDEDTIKKWLAEHEEVPSDATQKPPDGDESMSQPIGEDQDFQGAPAETIEKGEEMDLVLPLPTEESETAQKERRARHRNRKKAMSCPSPQILFSEVPYAGPTSIQLAVVQEETQSDTRSEEGEFFGEPTATASTLRRRPRRVKTMSCPAHLLKAEADRQIAANYFFG